MAFLPAYDKKTARIWLLNTGITIERLNAIREEDAMAEGILRHKSGNSYLNYIDNKSQLTQFIYNQRTARDSFKTLWWLIDGKDSWFANPWVWVIHFEVLSTTGRPSAELINQKINAFTEG